MFPGASLRQSEQATRPAIDKPLRPDWEAGLVGVSEVRCPRLTHTKPHPEGCSAHRMCQHSVCITVPKVEHVTFVQVARELANRRARAPLKPVITEHWEGAQIAWGKRRLLPIVERLDKISRGEPTNPDLHYDAIVRLF